METAIATMPGPPGRRYFALRALAAMMDCVVFGAFFFAYVYHFGTPTDGGYQVEGCGHFLVLSGVWLLWFPLPEALLGRTLGKWACDLRVVNLKNGPLTFGQVLTRRLLDVVDLWAFFGLVGFIVARNNPLQQRVGDLVARTRVIEEPASGSAA
jgi:uncharacterized RDD family membrane protein YckC